MGRPKIELTGKSFGRLVVLSPLPSQKDRTYWLCRCDCGVEKPVQGNHLRSGVIVSCGCYRDMVVGKAAKEANTTHGLSYSSTHSIWRTMLKRCKNPRSKSYLRYGGRGIKVCTRWHSFENFLADMGERPEGMTLDRKNNEDHYRPSNCRWATTDEQSSNKSTNVFYEFNGKRMILRDWAKMYNVSRDVLRYRIRSGWDFGLALLLN